MAGQHPKTNGAAQDGDGEAEAGRTAAHTNLILTAAIVWFELRT
jgi:hypothetical protein